jgi:putative sterol carrier protein
MTMEERFLAQIRKIDEKVDLDNEFPDWNKSIQFKIKEKGLSFYFVVDRGKVAKAEKGTLTNPDVTIEGNAEAISDFFDGKIPVIGAFITKELTITGAIGDALGAKVLLDAARIF